MCFEYFERGVLHILKTCACLLVDREWLACLIRDPKIVSSNSDQATVLVLEKAFYSISFGSIKEHQNLPGADRRPALD